MIQNSYPQGIINGEKGDYCIDEYIASSGKYASLYKVTPINNTSIIYLAKFFKIKYLMEHPRIKQGLGTKDQRAFKRFKKEPRFLKLFEHPNIVSYIDKYIRMDEEVSDSNKCFYIQEYLSGKSLRNHIEESSVPGNPIKIALGIASALVELRKKMVIHRDIHPGNIFISNSNPKLIDFGCAIGAGITKPYKYEKGEFTRMAGEFHRAPEAINPTEALFESDIYSFGITLLELLNNRMPSDTERDRKEVWIDHNLNKLSTCQPKFKSLITQMLNDKPESRPSSDEVYRTIEEILTKESSKIRVARPNQVSSDHNKYKTPIIIFSGIIFTAITGGMIWKNKAKIKKFLNENFIKKKVSRIRIVFLDLDGTLAHANKEDDQSIILPHGDKYLSQKTIENLKIIAEVVPIILVTCRKATHYESIRKLIPHKYAVFESGAIIFDYLKGQINWQGDDAKKLKNLREYELNLNKQGVKTIKDGRLASFRIIKKENSELKKSNLNIPKDIEFINNGPFWDFVLKEAGNENAVQFLLEIMNFSLDDGVFVSNKLNNLSLLKIIGCPITFANAKKRVVKTVKERGGYITQKPNHEGINEIFGYIKNNLDLSNFSD